MDISSRDTTVSVKHIILRFKENLFISTIVIGLQFFFTRLHNFYRFFLIFIISIEASRHTCSNSENFVYDSCKLSWKQWFQNFKNWIYFCWINYQQPLLLSFALKPTKIRIVIHLRPHLFLLTQFMSQNYSYSCVTLDLDQFLMQTNLFSYLPMFTPHRCQYFIEVSSLTEIKYILQICPAVWTVSSVWWLNSQNTMEGGSQTLRQVLAILWLALP